MGFDFGLNETDLCLPRKHRWLFFIEAVSADGINALPPFKAARPTLTFKEMEAQHLNETIYFPQKPDWKPINLTLYEPRSRTNPHPIFEWIKKGYNPDPDSEWKPSVIEGAAGPPQALKVPEARLELYDGCGEIMEKWKFETVYPQVINFGDLDMSSGDIVTVDVTLRYDRAFIER